MRCPTCGVDDDRVIDSRSTEGGAAVRRRRECERCGSRFTTFERIELPELLVRKRNGALVAFDGAKVREGMARAAKGRISDEQLDVATHAVEAALRALASREVTSEQVGLQVLSRLRDLDHVSYLRFASVYKDFQGTEDFEQELTSLLQDAPPKR